MKRVREIKSVSIYKDVHPNLYRAVTVGDNVTAKEFPNLSHFIAGAAEEKLANREADNVTNDDILKQLESLYRLVETIKRFAPNNEAVNNTLDEARSIMKVKRGRR